MNLAETQRLLWDLLHGRERPLDAFSVRPIFPRRSAAPSRLGEGWIAD